MITLFKEYISKKNLLQPEDRILVAVSGGIDSMVMADLFIKSGYKIALAHCNFNLRGEESDDDQKFVKTYAEAKNIDFYTVSFKTKSYANERGLSIQMAARDLRYNWLKKIREENGYNYIAIGHNRDDSIETFFINLIRGTGLHGLTGIKYINENIIRPVLFASRKQIIEYASENNISYREDSSNSETKYQRNKIRHIIIPEIEKINPHFIKKMEDTMNNLHEYERYLSKIVSERCNQIITNKKDEVIVDLNKIDPENDKIILFEILKEYGFNPDQITSIINSINSIPGKLFFSHSHRVVKDRDRIIISENKATDNDVYYINDNDKEISKPIKLSFKKVELTVGFNIKKESSFGNFDYLKLKFPLELRRWKTGDRFIPLGMKNFKKLSDFFSDNKLSIADKEKVWLLLSGNEIIWIVNHRIDDRFKVTSQTKNVLFVTYFNK